ncbi:MULTISPECIES: phage minor head protein [unclassified Oceanobacillus]|uniref:phage head morphogenesis protein n=1 Tax=unclassified Oceanobacillus TaxID=2630292 RepID=UPI001BE73FD0|nr:MULTISPECIES: phage minor head protein [unclassified Oceanobacillus]MBT2601411.1 hypothetical protein [Oceanobacillus sp. ISL-74]MBT2653312.1 hypothetical protein [Oceanobacillus sp. ISL-73]
MNKEQRQRKRYLDSLENSFEKEIISSYQVALKEVRAKLSHLYETTNGSWVEANKHNRLTKLEQELGKEIGKLTGKTAQTLSKSQRHLFEESYYFTGFVLSNAVKTDLQFAMLNTDLVKESIKNPLDRIGFLQRNRDNQAYLVKKMREELTQGLIQGESYATTAKRLKKRMDKAAESAITIAQTENHRVRQAGELASMEQGVKAGIDIKKRWLAAADGSTRDAHQHADGQTVDIDKPFKVDGEELMYPGDPAGSAENVINCRCEAIEIIGGFEPNKRIVRGVGITDYENYNDYKRKGLIRG